MSRRAVKSFFICLIFALTLPAAEQVVLDNGKRIAAERIECQDGRLVLFTEGGGRIELDAARVVAIEHLPDAPAPLVDAAVPDAPGLAAAPAVPLAADPAKVRDMVAEAAVRYGLPTVLVQSVAQVESAYHPDAVSPKGAIGVMQLMPSTAKQLEADPADLVQNIDAGTRLLRDLLLKYQDAGNGVRRALAAYNAGAGAVERFGGVPPYRETQSYVERVIELYWKNVRASDAAQH